MKISVLFFFVLAGLLLSCNSPKNIQGTYISNFAVNGYFITKIIIHGDSTLEYSYSGDNVFDTATAKYTIKKNKLQLLYFPIVIDTSDWPSLRKMGITIMEKELNKNGKSAPYQLLLKRNKLFLINPSGKIIRTKLDKNSRKRKYYLKRFK